MKEELKKEENKVEPENNKVEKPVFKMPVEEKSDMPQIKNKEEENKKIESTKEKILRFFGNSPEKFMKKGETRMETNPNLKKMYEEVKGKDPERAEKLKTAFGKYDYAKWDDGKKDYVDAGRYTESVNK